jgi:hypothetical protein
MFDNAFYLTLLFLLLSTLIGTFLSGRRKDKCLKDYAGFQITLDEKSGKMTWGILHVEKTGLELLYKEDYIDQDHVEKSYIMYKNEFGNIHLLFRYIDELTKKNRKIRDRDKERIYHPTFYRRWARSIRNIFNTISDRIKEAFTLLVGQAKKVGSVGNVIGGREQYLDRMQSELTGAVQHSYDPILETLIGKKVVFEVTKNDTIIEYVGILKEYTAEFIEFLDIACKDSFQLKSDGTTKHNIGSQIILGHEDNGLTIHNDSSCDIILKKITGENGEKNVDITIPQKGAHTLTVKEPALLGKTATLVFETVRIADFIIPRANGIVRHRGE